MNEVAVTGTSLTAAGAVGVALLLPLAGALLTVVLGRRPNLREGATLLVSGGLFALVASVVAPAVLAGGRPRLVVTEVFPGVPLAFEVEPLGALFALVASGLWVVTTLYSIGYLRGHGETNQTRFYACFAVAIFGALGVAFAANVFTLFVFYEVITLSTFPLVTHHGTEQAKRAGRTYLGILMGTSVAFLLLAMVWTYRLAGTTDFRPGGILAGKAGPGTLALLLALYAFGTGKAALMPFHRWLPAAMVAPTPVSALLHAVAVVKAGVFTVLKVIVYVFGLDLLQETGANGWLIWVASATLLIAAVVAIYQDNLKRRLAYSTISQLAYIVLGAALANASGVIGGGMHIAMHAFGKITLFFCAGAIYVGAHKTEISEMHGLGRRMPFTFLAFLVGSLSVIGLPPTGGAWSKWFLVLGAVESGSWVAVVVLLGSALLAIGYLMPVVVALYPHAHRGTVAGRALVRPHEIHEAPFLCVLPPVLTAAGCIVLFFYAGEIQRLLTGMVTP
jgi:multicomponent Na+:H+ antiporter subunit D